MKSYMQILKKFNYEWIFPPLIVGGYALYYHNIRKPGEDLDLIVSEDDWQILKKKYPNTLNLFGGKDENEIDATLNIKNPEKIDIIKTLWKHNYNDFIQDSIEDKDNNVRIISIPNLLYIKSFPSIKFMDDKSKIDVQKIVEHQIKEKYKN